MSTVTIMHGETVTGRLAEAYAALVIGLGESHDLSDTDGFMAWCLAMNHYLSHMAPDHAKPIPGMGGTKKDHAHGMVNFKHHNRILALSDADKVRLAGALYKHIKSGPSGPARISLILVTAPALGYVWNKQGVLDMSNTMADFDGSQKEKDAAVKDIFTVIQAMGGLSNPLKFIK